MDDEDDLDRAALGGDDSAAALAAADRILARRARRDRSRERQFERALDDAIRRLPPEKKREVDAIRDAHDSAMERICAGEDTPLEPMPIG